MILDYINELSLGTVLNRGVANRECIPIQVVEQVNMAQFGLMVGVCTDNQVAVPIVDSLFWFGEGIVEEKDWIFVYTGSGEHTMTKSTLPGASHNVFTLHWGRTQTMFANSNIVPILFKMGGVSISYAAQDVPQLSELP